MDCFLTLASAPAPALFPLHNVLRVTHSDIQQPCGVGPESPQKFMGNSWTNLVCEPRGNFWQGIKNEWGNVTFIWIFRLFKIAHSLGVLCHPLPPAPISGSFLYREISEAIKLNPEWRPQLFSSNNITCVHRGADNLWSCGPMDKALAYGARDSRFDPWQDRTFCIFFFFFFSIYIFSF